MKTRRMSIAYWEPKATNTHSDYVLFIAFPRQQWLGERASILRYTYTAYPECLHLVVGGGGFAGFNVLTGYAGGNFLFLVGPPKTDWP